MRIRRILAAAAVLAFGFAGPGHAEGFGLLTYRLGMTLEEFYAQPIPGGDGIKGLAIKCFDDPKLHGQVYGVTGRDFMLEPKVGAKTCTFLRPDSMGLKDSWVHFAAPFQVRTMYWLFTFLRDQPQAGPYRLFKVLATYDPSWEHRADRIDNLRPSLQQLYGPGTDPHRDLVKIAATGMFMSTPLKVVYDELVWHQGDETAEFFEEPVSDDLNKPSFCIGLVSEPMMAEYNRRLKQVGLPSWMVCQPVPERDPLNSAHADLNGAKDPAASN